MIFRLAILSALVIATPLVAAPFQVHSTAELRADYGVSWSDFSTTNGAPVPDGQTFSVSVDGDIEVFGSGLTIQSSGAKLAVPNLIDIVPPVLAQGFGVVAEHVTGGTLTLSIWDATPAEIGRFTVVASSPVFIGIVDPDANIATISIEASPGGFAIADPIFQTAPAIPDLAAAPVTSEHSFRINPRKTYLHEGLKRIGSTPATITASQSYPNVCDFGSAFPTLLTGDILRIERVGIARDDEGLIPVVAVFSGSETISSGTDFHRVPDAIDAAGNWFTDVVENESGIGTHTNISEDFQVGTSSFIVVPQGAEYAFFTLARPGDIAFAPRVRIGHIQRDSFLEWAATFGLVGPLADPTDDMDGDGLTLIEEYAYKKNPTENEAGGNALQIVTGSVPSRLEFSFTGRSDVPLRYIPEFSDDLSNWTPVTPVTTFSSPGLADFLAADPVGGVRRFGRLSIEIIARP